MILSTLIFAALALPRGAIAAEEDTKPLLLPCTAKSPSSGFYDLRPIMVLPLEEGSKKTGKEKTDSWQSKGHDYNGNFSINICAPVMEEVEDVVGIERNLWQNVSAFYERDGKTYSIGQQSSNLTVRGRKLVLQYTGGSPCGPDADTKSLFDRSLEEIYEDLDRYDAEADLEAESTAKFPYHDAIDSDDEDDEDDENDEDDSKKGDSKPSYKGMRKSTTISFHCERDPLKALAVASFVGTDPNECAYFFEVRSPYACPGSEPVELGGVGPGGVFGIIAAVFVVVYFVGGVVYNRSVTHARGWRQLPNYAMWAGIWGFLSDMAVILFSSCARCMPGRRGYSAIAGSGRVRRSDDENRLIDNLDEEWDD